MQIQWDDLLSLGLPADSMISGIDNRITVTPTPPKLVGKLIAAATANPPPEGDRLAYLRHVRDLLMGLTDYTQANDSPLSAEQRTVWAAYRQALRDLPQTYSGDGPIPWPVAP